MTVLTAGGIVLEPNPTVPKSREPGWREVIPELLSEPQIGVLVGEPGIGKSLLMAHLSVSLVRGLPWCGYQLEPRSIAYLNLGQPRSYLGNLARIAQHHGAAWPRIPEEVEEHVLNLGGSAAKRGSILLDTVEGVLIRKPNALVVVDSINGWWQGAKLEDLYIEMRRRLSRDNRRAAALFLYDTRPTQRARRLDLAKDPYEWLYAQVPSSVLDRPDLRLGMDRRTHQERVLAGFKREVGNVAPIWLRCVGSAPHEWAGFEPCAPHSQ